MLTNLLLTSHANVAHTMVLHDGQLVYSSLSRGATQQLHHLVSQLLGSPAATAGGSGGAKKTEALHVDI